MDGKTEPTRSAEVLMQKIAEEAEKNPEFVETLKSPVARQALTDSAVVSIDGATNAKTREAQAQSSLTAASADKVVYVIAVVALGLVSVGAVGAIMLICVPQIEPLTEAGVKAAGGDPLKLAGLQFTFSVPDGLIALGSAAIGALAGLLGPLSARK